MSQVNLQIIVATVLFLWAACLMARRSGLGSPFSLAAGGMAIACLAYLINPIQADELGLQRSSYLGLSARTAQFILMAAGLMLVVAFKVKPLEAAPRSLVKHIQLPLGLYLLCAVIALFEASLISWRNGGVPPILSMGDYGRRYAAYQIPLLSPFAYGIGRLCALALGLELATAEGGIKSHFERNRLKYLIVGLTLAANSMIGLRSNFILPAINIGCAYMAFRRLSTRFFIIGFISLFLAFISLGNLRIKDLSLATNDQALKFPSGITWLDNVQLWVGLYTAPNLPNLGQAIDIPSQPQGGRVLISQIVPDSILRRIMDPPTTTIDFLQRRRLLPFRGYTFRTIYADLLADFGYFGALIAGTIVLIAMVLAWNYRARSIFALMCFINFSSSLIFFPLKEQFTGMPTLLPMVFGLVIITLVKVTLPTTPISPRSPRHRPPAMISIFGPTLK